MSNRRPPQTGNSSSSLTFTGNTHAPNSFSNPRSTHTRQSSSTRVSAPAPSATPNAITRRRPQPRPTTQRPSVNEFQLVKHLLQTIRPPGSLPPVLLNRNQQHVSNEDAAFFSDLSKATKVDSPAFLFVRIVIVAAEIDGILSQVTRYSKDNRLGEAVDSSWRASRLFADLLRPSIRDLAKLFESLAFDEQWKGLEKEAKNIEVTIDEDRELLTEAYGAAGRQYQSSSIATDTSDEKKLAKDISGWTESIKNWMDVTKARRPNFLGTRSHYAADGYNLRDRLMRLESTTTVVNAKDLWKELLDGRTWLRLIGMEDEILCSGSGKMGGNPHHSNTFELGTSASAGSVYHPRARSDSQSWE